MTETMHYCLLKKATKLPSMAKLQGYSTFYKRMFHIEFVP